MSEQETKLACTHPTWTCYPMLRPGYKYLPITACFFAIDRVCNHCRRCF